MDFNGREWDVQPEKKLVTRVVENRRAQGWWSSHVTTLFFTYQATRMLTHPEACKPSGVHERRQRQRRGAAGNGGSDVWENCTPSCCYGHYFLSLPSPPLPSPANGATSAADAGGGSSGARGRSQRGRGESTANRRRGMGNEASNALGEAVDTHGDGEPCWREDGRVVIGGWDPAPDPTGRNCCDDGLDGTIRRGSKDSTRIWISYSECCGSERGPGIESGRRPQWRLRE